MDGLRVRGGTEFFPAPRQHHPGRSAPYGRRHMSGAGFSPAPRRHQRGRVGAPAPSPSARTVYIGGVTCSSSTLLKAFHIICGYYGLLVIEG